jgi:hypothetical protein
LLDAIPGIVLRLQTHQASTFFAARQVHSWSPRWLHDQQLAGGVLWTVAEVLDLPFLVVLFLRWYRTDVREAGAVDAVLDAEQIVRSAARKPTLPADAADAADPVNAADPADPADPSVVSDDPPPDDVEPWWWSDPVMRERMRRQG